MALRIKPPKATVKVEGMRELRATLLDLSKKVQGRILKGALEKAAEPIRATAEALAPRDTSITADSIDTSQRLTKRQARLAGKTAKRQADGSFRSAKSTGAEIHVGPSAPKGRKAPDPAGIMQEFGTRHHGPQPFMRPAWDQHKGEALDIIKDELSREIGKAAKRAAARARRKK